MMELVVKTLDGTPVTHDVTENTVRLKTPDGESVDFVAASDVPVAVEKTVELDFSGGDMVVTPDNGQVFSGVNIPVPATLIPENIAEGVDIAGIIGTLVAGGGGGVKLATGTVEVTGSGYYEFVSTNHGFKPDFIACFAASESITVRGKVSLCFGLSSALSDATSSLIKNVGVQMSAQSISTIIRKSTQPIDNEHTDGLASIREANDNGFTMPYPFVPGTMQYIIIGGLT